MKKILLTAIAVVGFGFAAQAQDEGGFRVGIHAGMPMGDAGDIYTFNAGADVAYTWPIADSFTAGITTGYSYYAGEEIDMGPLGTTKVNGAFIPVAATGKYELSEKIFLGADLGYALYAGDGESDGGFYYQPKVGFQTEMIDIFLGYKGISADGATISSINVGAAYKF
jgi:hypothetical protein